MAAAESIAVELGASVELNAAGQPRLVTMATQVAGDRVELVDVQVLELEELGRAA